MQIAPPTREDVEAYTDIRTELEGLSGSINGEFGDFDWTPLRYIHRAVPRPTLAALFRASQVGLVTPLRDGMNLVAKEYVAAQDGRSGRAGAFQVCGCGRGPPGGRDRQPL
jgi:trehalose 6-phosphate synthase